MGRTSLLLCKYNLLCKTVNNPELILLLDFIDHCGETRDEKAKETSVVCKNTVDIQSMYCIWTWSRGVLLAAD